MRSNRHSTSRRTLVRGLVRVVPPFSFVLCTLTICVFVATWSKLKPSEEFKPLSPAEVALVKRTAGIYEDATKVGDFEDVILVTAGNFGYVDMYTNWACHARRLGLKWLLIASDEEIYNEAGPDQAILSQNAAAVTSEATRFREVGFNLITCSKLQDVMRISQSARVDVVFSDCDNVFRADPFAMGASLAEAIRSRLYEYVYQHNENQSTWATEPFEGNTGFYYISGRRKRAGLRNLYSEALHSCKNRPEIDDQTNFWDAFRHMRSGVAYVRWRRTGGSLFSHRGAPFKSARFCSRDKIFDRRILSYCSLNASQHPVGFHDELSAMVTYHANYRVGHDSKKERLKQLGLWFDESCPM